MLPKSIQVRGVPIRIHRSSPVLPVFIALFITVILLSIDPGMGWGRGCLSVAAGTLIMLVSLIIHEAAHAAVALRHDLGPVKIHIWFAGAACERTSTAPSPSSLLAIASAGPLTNLCLATAILFVRGGWGVQHPSDPILMVALWSNLLLGLGNLLPLRPFDGGQILSALLWGCTGDHAQAERLMRRFSQAVALAVVFLGIPLVALASAWALGIPVALMGFYLLKLASGDGVLPAESARGTR